MTRPTIVLAAVAVLAAALTGCLPTAGGGTTTAPGTPAGATAAEHVPAGTLDAAAARTALAELRVAAPGPLTGYVRDCDNGEACVFGQPWKDTDGDGCDQRSQVLARDMTEVKRKPGRCAVTAGTLADPYTGKTIASVSKVQIEHVVPLAEMWRSGAAAWPLDKRVQAANDLRNLLAVDGKTNQAKGSKTPDAWMPPNTAYACPYARIYVGMKAGYGLTVTRAERAALETALATCR